MSRIRCVSLRGILLLGKKDVSREGLMLPLQVKRKQEKEKLRSCKMKEDTYLPSHSQFKKLHFTTLTKESTLKLKSAVHKMTGRETNLAPLLEENRKYILKHFGFNNLRKVATK